MTYRFRDSHCLQLLALAFLAILRPQATFSDEFDHGDLRLNVEDYSQSPELPAALSSSKLFEGIAEDFNSFIKLPRNITARFTSCNKETAYYDSLKGEIYICYELLQYYWKEFTEDKESSAEVLQTKVSHTALSIFFHELSHALITELKLPIKSKSEEAVDDLATILAIQLGGERERALLFALFERATRAVVSKTEITPYQLTHWPDQQRIEALACTILGSNPEKYTEFVENGEIPEDRLERCPAEYEQKVRHWDKLLTPWLRD